MEEKPVTAKIPGKMTSGIPSRRTVWKSPSIWVQQGSRPFFQGPHPATGWCLLRSAVVHLLVQTYWPREESLKLSLLVLHQLASWHLSGGRGAQREWKLKDKCGTNPLSAFPQPGTVSYYTKGPGALPRAPTLHPHQHHTQQRCTSTRPGLSALPVHLIATPGPNYVPRTHGFVQHMGNGHDHLKMGAPRASHCGHLFSETIMSIHEIKIAYQMHLYLSP